MNSNTKVSYFDTNNAPIEIASTLTGKIIKFKSPQISDGSTNTVFSLKITNAIDITS